MAWYYGKFSCGCEGRVNVIGPMKNRQYIADRKFEGLCPECYQSKLERDKERDNTIALEKAAEMGLPELKGTEKQVPWANTLRHRLIQEFQELEYKDRKDRKDREELTIILDYILREKKTAQWYIDNRYTDIFTIINKIKPMAMKPEEEKIQEELELKRIEEIKAECTVFPAENCQYEEAAEISLSTEDRLVTVNFSKNDEFREIVKNLGYTWNSQKKQWYRKIYMTNGTVEDRAVEVGNVLLNNGFPIRIMEPDLLQKAISGDFIPEHKRWIFARTEGEYEGRLAINWDGRNDELYQRARKLPSSIWDSPSVVVKVEYYEHVEEYARINYFKFTPRAKELIKKHKERMKLNKKVIPAPTTKEIVRDGLIDILTSEVGVLEDLIDIDED